MNKLIEAAWESYVRHVLPASAGQVQRDETRKAFYAGAAVLFHTVLRALDEGSDATENDLKLMDDISSEIDAFGAELDVAVLGVPAKCVIGHKHDPDEDDRELITELRTELENQ
jgi:hypothetical protein